jgi:hypothetical protein
LNWRPNRLQKTTGPRGEEKWSSEKFVVDVRFIIYYEGDVVCVGAYYEEHAVYIGTYYEGHAVYISFNAVPEILPILQRIQTELYEDHVTAVLHFSVLEQKTRAIKCRTCLQLVC